MKHSELQRISNELVGRGYAFLDALPLETRSRLLEAADSPAGSRLYSEDEEMGTHALAALGFSQEDLLLIHSKVFSSPADISSFYFIRRETCGSNQSEAYRMHFDSHRLTIVVPLRIPDLGGRLIMFPRLRSEPANAFINLLQKVWYKKLSGSKSVEKLKRRKEHVFCDFKDHKPVIFLGRSTLHGNDAFPESDVSRVTCLIHCFDPEEGYGVGHIMRDVKRRFFRT